WCRQIVEDVPPLCSMMMAGPSPSSVYRTVSDSCWKFFMRTLRGLTRQLRTDSVAPELCTQESITGIRDVQSNFQLFGEASFIATPAEPYASVDFPRCRSI